MFLSEFYEENKSWFRKCNEYNSDTLIIYQRENLDFGESGTLAQNLTLGGNHILLLDEKKARKFAVGQQHDHHGTLWILAKLDIMYGKVKYREAVDTIRNSGQRARFSEQIIQQVYDSVKKSVS